MESAPLTWLVSLGVAAATGLATLRAAAWLRHQVEAERARSGATVSVGRRWIERGGAALGLRLPRRTRDWLQHLLVRGGEREEGLPALLGTQIAGAAVGLAAGTILLLIGIGLPALLFCVVLGALAPLLRALDRAKARRKQILRAFPFQLDLLALAVEAGLEFALALEKVVERGSAGPLRDELALVLRELRMGRSRRAALETLVARTALPPIERFVRAVIQADRMGISLGGSLQELAEELRDERFLRAERLAAEAPVKMLFPLLFFIFPCVFLVLFGPLVFAIL